MVEQRGAVSFGTGRRPDEAVVLGNLPNPHVPRSDVSELLRGLCGPAIPDLKRVATWKKAADDGGGGRVILAGFFFQPGITLIAIKVNLDRLREGNLSVARRNELLLGLDDIRELGLGDGEGRGLQAPPYELAVDAKTRVIFPR